MTPLETQHPKTWALVPARGGSKSIPGKNLVPLGGRPLLEYGVAAAQACGRFERIVCSTDDAEIASAAEGLGIEVDPRPRALAGDEVAVAEVAREFLGRAVDPLPDVLVLVQPTSPFLRVRHIVDLLDAMERDPDAHSAQNLCPIPHNYHAWNQRLYSNGRVRFLFAEERARAYNKQRKPKLFGFGNLVAIRTQWLLAGEDFFAEPSVGLEIEWPYNLDLDGPDDLRLAEALLAAGRVSLD